jgi:NTP pyrophosphatase (non-canonical NTP hydrolase)
MAEHSDPFFINNPNKHKGLSPNDLHVIGGRPPVEVRLKNGLYSRNDIDLDMDIVTQRLIDKQATVLDYQYWAELNWKTKHGTSSSVERFTDKLREEQGELLKSIADQELPKDINSELGDVLWCTSALASNGAADIDAGMKNRLFRYVVGTQWIKSNQGFAPVWREKAAELAVKHGPLTLHELDDLVSAGFEPSISPVMNIDDYEEQDALADHLNNLTIAIEGSRVFAERQYGWESDKEDKSFVIEARFEQLARALGEQVAEVFFEVGFIGNRETKTSISQLAQQNVEKIGGRVAHNQVDKTDNPRD